MPRVTPTPQSDARPATPVVRCRGVRKSYRAGAAEIPALRGVDYEIAAPGFYAIMGQSGSGKSTLLHLLAALDRPDEGSIEIAGEPIDCFSERQATAFRRRRIGIVFQQFNLIPSLTAAENVELPGLLAGADRPWLEARRTELLEMLSLTEKARRRPDALSGGEQQRVAIARALLFSPPILLADEPTGNLDSTSSERLWTLLADLADRGGLTIVMVTHEPAAAAHCRRVAVLQDGRVLGEFDTGGLDAGGLAARYQQCVRAS